MQFIINGKKYKAHKIILTVLKNDKVLIENYDRNFIITDNIIVDTTVVQINTEVPLDDEEIDVEHPHHPEMGQAF